MPNPALFAAHGSQPEKPTRYKPIWTDRFFNGYFSNRNPFRSPLSAYYADGWGLGKTDALIDGLNVELSPRLTLIRRPGSNAFSTATLPTAPNSFYSFHRSDGVITLIADTASSVSKFDNSSVTSLYSKPSNAGQSVFQGSGMNLYWGDGTVAQKWNATDNTQYQMGIVAPPTATGISQVNTCAGQAISLTGVSFASGGYVSTTSQLSNPNNFSIECWFKCNSASPANLPLMSFESSQTGASTTVLHALYIDANGYLTYTVRDTLTNSNVIVKSTQQITDTLVHHVVLSVAYSSTITAAVSYNKGVPISSKNAGSQKSSPDPTVTSNFYYNNTPTFSSGPAPRPMQVLFYLDGSQAYSAFPNVSLPTTSGFWRIAKCSAFTGGPTFVAFNGVISEVSVYLQAVGAVRERFRELVLVAGIAAYETTVSDAGAFYFWKLKETVGTTAADSIGANTGTYQTTVALNQSIAIPYLVWAATTAYVLGQYIVDPNFNLQKCTGAGTSGAAPVWATYTGQITADGGVSWTNQGSVGLQLTVGSQYAFAYVNKYGHYSTLSPLQISTGPKKGQAVKIIGNVSSDPQVTQIAIFRTPDGGTMPFYVDTINNTYPGNGVFGYTDTSSDAELNILMAGPQANSNDPPPYGLTNLVFHLGRMWGSVGNLVYASGGPDTLVGNGNEAWPPANYWAVSSQVTRLVPTASGILVFTTSGVDMIAGGPAISQFYTQTVLPKVGLLSYNALDVSGSQITLFTADRQLVQFDPSGGLTEIGFPIADKLALFDPTKVSVTRHINGLDNALFVGDGSTGWYRCCPQQPPDYSITGPVWSPKATVASGATAIISLETSPGVYQVLYGQPSVNGLILVRDSSYSTFSDTTSFTTTNVTVPGTTPPWLWNNAFNSAYGFGGFGSISGPPNPVVLSGMSTGQLVVITATGTVTDPGSGTFGPNGNLSDMTGGGPGGFGYYPSHFAPSAAGKIALIGAFTDGSGNIISVVDIGASATLVVPSGATQLQLGINDNSAGDNTGSFSISVTSVPVRSAYSSYFTLGNIVLAQPGELAEVGFIAADLMKVGTQPAVSILMDEISGAFTVISSLIVADPPVLYGPTAQPATLYSNRYYMKQVGMPPAWCRHMQLKFDFGNTDTVMNELLTSTLWGAILAEGA